MTIVGPSLRRSAYDKFPVVPVGTAGDCPTGWRDIAATLLGTGARVIVVDAYPGVRSGDLDALAAALAPATRIDSETALLPAADIDRMVAPDMGDDPVFGRLSDLELPQFFDPAKLAALADEVRRSQGRVVVTGAGAALVDRGDLLVHAGLPRREIELRQNAGEIGSLGANNIGTRPSELYKRAYFVDWRAADRHKELLWPDVDYFLDTTRRDEPALVAAASYFDALSHTASRPFRVVPWFEPAPWGGRWMRDVCDLPPDVDNFGWCFDCVPEENSLLLGFGDATFETASNDLVRRHPIELLGPQVVDRFGANFPIRFDFLDTMGGGNLSLQVHPLTDYIREQFGMSFTQDESYYLLDAGDDAVVYLGLRTGVDRDAMLAELKAANAGGPAFQAERHVNIWPARKHDHFLIPAGTVHCSGANSMVLEISATPYIFTFKLWDWSRPGLDGRPRPVHLDHGANNIQWHRDTDFTRRELVNHITPLGEGPGWRSERTGLHEAEFIETHRHWFNGPVDHHTDEGVNVLNLCEGAEVTVESPHDAFEPFVVHYAETFIVPAAVGAYRIRPSGPAEGSECATIKAFVRPAVTR